jgi:hypothetical protein
MLPTNPQALTATDRAVLDNLKQQGEQIDRQTKVLETLVDKVTRQMRSDEKLEKNDKKNQIKGDTKVKDVPGILFDKFSDGLNDFISNGFNKIKDKFKDEKSKPAEKNKESSAKDKTSKDETDILKSLLNNMVTTSKYQEQMLEHTKAIQDIADKTFVSINDLKDNLQNIEQPENNTTPKSNENIPEKKENNNKVKPNKEKQTPALFLPKENLQANNEVGASDKKLPDSIGAAVGKSLKPQLDVLGTTFKTSLAEGFNQLDESISNLKGIDLPKVIPTPPTVPPATTTPGPVAAAATTASPLLAAGVVTGVAVGGAALSYGAANYLRKLDDQSLETLTNSGGGDDTAFASAIQLQARKNEEKINNPEQADIRKIDNAIDYKNRPQKTGTNGGPMVGRGGGTRLKQQADQKSLENIKTEEATKEAIIKSKTDSKTLNTVTQKKAEKTSLMKEVTDQKTELASDASKASPPVIINNTNNNVADSGSSMSFASARSTDPNDSVRDYKRNNARLFDAA